MYNRLRYMQNHIKKTCVQHEKTISNEFINSHKVSEVFVNNEKIKLLF